jgi:preprotein translocase subunit SecE
MKWIDKGIDFLRESRAELKKVTWPDRADVYSTTLVVLITVFIISAYLFVVDFGLRQLIEWVFSTFKGQS